MTDVEDLLVRTLHDERRALRTATGMLPGTLVEMGLNSPRMLDGASGFGAGAVGGYAVLRLDPAIVAREAATEALVDGRSASHLSAAWSSEDVQAAFGS